MANAAEDAEEEKREDGAEEAPTKDSKSKARMIKEQMRDKIREREEAFRAKHTFPITRRAQSCFLFKGVYQRCKILEEPDMLDAHIWFQHPTRQY